MKNIHLIATDKPSRLSILNSGKLNFGAEIMSSSNSRPQNLYITNDEEIKEGDYSFYPPFGVSKNIIIDGELVFHIEAKNGKGFFTQRTYQTLDRNKKIILTTDQELIKDCVQPIDDEFLEWFVENPSCEEVEIENWYNKYLSCCRSKEECYCNKKRIIIPQEEHPNQIKCYCGHTTTCDCSPLEEPKQFTPEMLVDLKQGLDNAIQKSNPLFPNYNFLNKKEEPKQETLEEVEKVAKLKYGATIYGLERVNAFKAGYKLAQERSYSEEEVYHILVEHTAFLFQGGKSTLSEWFEQFKKK
jgi:hypothetical protein